MKFLDLPKPHGFLIWRGQQQAIASDKPLLINERLVILSNGELFGEAILAPAIPMSLAQFEAYKELHCIRPQERKLYWPDASIFYVHHFKLWQPYEAFVRGDDGRKSRIVPAIPFQINGDDIEFGEVVELTDMQRQLLSQAEELPKTLVLIEEAVTLEGAEFVAQIDISKVEPAIRATIGGFTLDDATLPLYQLALVRVPRLTLKRSIQCRTNP